MKVLDSYKSNEKSFGGRPMAAPTLYYRKLPFYCYRSLHKVYNSFWVKFFLADDRWSPLLLRYEQTVVLLLSKSAQHYLCFRVKFFLPTFSPKEKVGYLERAAPCAVAKTAFSGIMKLRSKSLLRFSKISFAFNSYFS